LPDKAAVFIDGGYMDYVLAGFGRPAVDYERLSDELCARSGGYARFRTYYYHCPPYRGNPPTPDEAERYRVWQRFHDALLRHERFEFRLGKLEKRSCPACGDTRPRQKRVDSQLAIDIVRLAAKGTIAKAILIAGDSDHAPAVRTAKEDSVLVTLWHMRGNPRTVAHDELLRMCDERFEFTRELIDRVVRPAPP